MLLSPNFEKKLKHSNSASFCLVLRGQLKSLITQTRLLLLVGSVLAIPLTPPLGAQGISVTGVVRTAAGAPVVGATVTITAAGAQQDRHTASTGADGNFTIASLPTGPYTITVQLPGRPPTAPSAWNVDAASMVLAVSAENTLTISTESETPAPVVPNSNSSAAENAAGATGGEKLSSQSVSQLPLNGRDFSTLLLLAAGTMTDVNGRRISRSNLPSTGSAGVEAVFAMDGADISDPEMGGSTFTNFNVDAIQELQSSSGWMPAEIGRGAAGFTNIVTRSGQSGFHGSFFEFLRNSALDARNYFDHPSIADPGRIPPFRRNEFGFTNGGPVVLPHLYDGRGRTFYFGSIRDSGRCWGRPRCWLCRRPAERAGQDVVTYPDGSTDTLQVPVESGRSRR